MGRRKQQEIPGTERKTNREVDDAAEVYEDARDRRQGLSKEEKQAKTMLIEVMGKHGLNVYKNERIEVLVADKGKDVKVRKVDQPEPDEIED